MHLLVYGPGRLGTALVGSAIAAGWAAPTVVGRPGGASRPPAPSADVVVDASQGGAVLENVDHALAGGNRLFVLATTGWDGDATGVRERLAGSGAAAVVAPNLSLGAAVFLRLAETAAAWYAAAGPFEPSVVEWHRAGKADRPSGTARAIARRIVAADPRWSAPDMPTDDALGRAPLEVFGVRSGSAPGTHLVTWDGPGESVELRLTARDRTAYADGALAAARWVVAEPREPGFHSFDAVVDELLHTPLATSIPA
jgi:4-hydroxy-tetrahydrodipicolinate reductase